MPLVSRVEQEESDTRRSVDDVGDLVPFDTRTSLERLRVECGDDPFRAVAILRVA